VWEARPKEMATWVRKVLCVGAGGWEAGCDDEGGCGWWGGGVRNSVDSDKGEGLGYGGGDPEGLGV
jgi:hypothetical protein